MFSGIVEKVAKLHNTRKISGSLVLSIAAPKSWKLKRGQSISIDGACLTVSKISRGWFEVEAMPETLVKTKFGRVTPRKVNLERAMRMDDAIDGHLVLGHVDAIGKVVSSAAQGRSKVVRFSFPLKYRKLVAEKASVAVDGVSLTVVRTSSNLFSVALVDYTISHTTLGGLKKGDLVNIEFDILAKYIQRITNSG